MKKWYESKTIQYALATGIVGIVTAFATAYPDIAILSTINSVAVIVLRLLTTTTISPTESQ